MHARLSLTTIVLCIVLAGASSALAQDRGSVDATPLPPLANPNDPKIAAKELFARKLLPAAMPPRVIGSYVKGCLGGAEPMPVTGTASPIIRPATRCAGCSSNW